MVCPCQQKPVWVKDGQAGILLSGKPGGRFQELAGPFCKIQGAKE
jgi:hypothetical protein